MPHSLTRQDARLEAALGRSVTSLIATEARADAATARLLDAHRVLTEAETAVAFQRVRLVNVATAKRRVDDAVLDQLDAHLEELEVAAERRDQLEADLVRLIEEHEHEAAREAEREQAAAASTSFIPLLLAPGAARDR
ncbi:hypothetical protein AB0D10_25260 [Kitasatospora sp. NPDC048545]|uniref:hypothetical protein n=1 Tax=Kitasatospora sp. NPDC048545 TaxID=3157208 RepID=UPI0033D255D2